MIWTEGCNLKIFQQKGNEQVRRGWTFRDEPEVWNKDLESQVGQVGWNQNKSYREIHHRIQQRVLSN